jgi:RHS repeat-associated protein
VVNLKADSTTLSSFGYALDAAGNRTSVLEANGDRVTWSYDGIYQLVREQRSGASAYDITYTYDTLGNRLTKVEGGVTTTYSYDEANQLGYEKTPSGRTTFSHDANGNLEAEQAVGGSTTYSWDFENMCVAMALPSGARNTFAYDAALKRRSAEDAAGLARFVHDGENVLLETDGGGETQVSYTLEPSLRPAGGPVGYGNLISQRRGSASAWHHFDALGSTDRLTDASESELASYVQTAFGVPKATTGSHPNRLRWIGRLGYRWEPDTNQYDVRRRRYDPARGRWTSRDAAREGSNWYVYAYNSPLQLDDPSGMACCIRPGTLLQGVSIFTDWAVRVRRVFCAYDVSASWHIGWGIGKGGDPNDCWVQQYVRERGQHRWYRDDKLGWPYPIQRNPKSCSTTDEPGLHPRIGPVVLARGTTSLHAHFLTCVCTTEGDIRCYRWNAALEIDLGKCSVTMANAFSLGRVPSSLMPEKCDRSVRLWPFIVA